MLYMVANGPMPTTAAPASVTTGTSIKTMLQILAPANTGITVVEWGISMDNTAVNTPIKCELIQTDVAATITAYVAADIYALNHLGGTNGTSSTEASQIQIGTTTKSGYTSSSEGSITQTRLGDLQLVSGAGAYIKQFPLGQGFRIVPGKFLRIRVTAGTAANAYCYVVWDE